MYLYLAEKISITHLWLRVFGLYVGGCQILPCMLVPVFDEDNVTFSAVLYRFKEWNMHMKPSTNEDNTPRTTEDNTVQVPTDTEEEQGEEGEDEDEIVIDKQEQVR